MKTLVTHINPHLDDIAAIWLFKKFNPEFQRIKVEFLKAGVEGVTWQGEGVDSDPEIIHFGIGKGKYDEHKGDVDDCATSLVWKDQKSSSSEHIETLALERLVEWVRLEDTGRLSVGEYDEFSVPAFIRSRDNNEESSRKSIELGSEILDRILKVLKRTESSKIDWEGKEEFETNLGKFVAIKSDTVDREFCKRKKGDLFLIFNVNNHYVQFFTPSHSLDLEPVYRKVKELDSQASWFLHHSHHMVICGSASAPDSNPTKLSYQELIDVVKGL